MPENIVLIGFMGSGKTAVGRELARRLQFDFVDLDAMIEQESGRAIADIFRDDGEEAFRDIEAAALLRLASATECVIATGGGTVLRHDNRDLMKRIGMTVHLAAGPGTVLRRLGGQTATRPLFAHPGGIEGIRKMMAVRARQYDVAEQRVVTDNLTMTEVAAAIEELWNAHAATGRFRLDGAIAAPTAGGAEGRR